jgi:hypothetical protein
MKAGSLQFWGVARALVRREEETMKRYCAILTMIVCVCLGVNAWSQVINAALSGAVSDGSGR